MIILQTALIKDGIIVGGINETGLICSSDI